MHQHIIKYTIQTHPLTIFFTRATQKECQVFTKAIGAAAAAAQLWKAGSSSSTQPLPLEAARLLKGRALTAAGHFEFYR